MIKMGRTIVESSIKQQYSNLSELELKIKVFERYYKNDFDEIEFQNIIRNYSQPYYAAQKENKWSFYSLTFEKIAPESFDKIFIEGILIDSTKSLMFIASLHVSFKNKFKLKALLLELV